jgi:hypothetical protein
MACSEDQHVEPVGPSPQRVLLVVGEMDDAIAGADVVDLLVLPREARPPEDEDDLLRGTVGVGRSREPARVDAYPVDPDGDGARGVPEPLPARGHLPLLAASGLDLVPMRDHHT